MAYYKPRQVFTTYFEYLCRLTIRLIHSGCIIVTVTLKAYRYGIGNSILRWQVPPDFVSPSVRRDAPSRAALYDNIQSLFRVELIIEKKLSKCIPLKASFYDKFAKTYHNFNLAPQVGLEPTTLRLTAACSTDWAIEEYLCWHLSIVPGRLQPSIVDTNELNFCVRYGNRWTLIVINTNY